MTDANAPHGEHEDLLRRFRTGRDPQALARLFDLAAPPLFRIALAVAPDAATAEEAVQETFLALLEDPDRPDLSQSLMAWMTAVVRHKVIDARRRAARTPDPLSIEPRLLPEDPADAAERRDARDRVRAAITDLPEPYRTVAVLRWEYGLEPGEIAHARGEPPGTVRSNLSRALVKLRGALGGVTALALVLGVRPPQGLAAVRRAVLEQAGIPVATVGFHVGGMAVSATAAWLVLAAALVTGSVTTAGVAALLAHPDATDIGVPGTARPRDVGPADAAPEGAPTRPIGSRRRAQDDGDAPHRSDPAPGRAAPPSEDADVPPGGASGAAGFPGANATHAPSPPHVEMTDSGVRREAHRLLDGLRTSWIEGWRVGSTLSEMRPAATIVGVLRERWPGIASGVARQNLLKGFAYDSTCEFRLDVFALGLDDPDPRVQDFATGYISPYAGRDLTGDAAAARAWLAGVAGTSPDALLDRSADALLTEARTCEASERARVLAVLDDVVARRRTPRIVEQVLASASVWIEDPDWLPDAAPILDLISAARPHATWSEAVFGALVTRGGESERRAVRLAGQQRIRSAWDAVAARTRSDDAVLAAASLRALAAFDDPRAIPIAVESMRGRTEGPVGAAAVEALEELTLISAYRGRDGAWWESWWAANRERYERSFAREEIR